MCGCVDVWMHVQPHILAKELRDLSMVASAMDGGFLRPSLPPSSPPASPPFPRPSLSPPPLGNTQYFKPVTAATPVAGGASASAKNITTARGCTCVNGWNNVYGGEGPNILGGTSAGLPPTLLPPFPPSHTPCSPVVHTTT